MAEDWNVCQDRLEVIAAASDPACTAQSNYLTWFLRHQPREDSRGKSLRVQIITTGFSTCVGGEGRFANDVGSS